MLNYETIKKKLIKENMKKVLEEYKNPDFQEKIDKYSKKFGLDKLNIEKRILGGDQLIISIFAKDPSKQNFYEKTAANFIEQIEGVVDFKNLPNGGKNALYVDKDTIRRNDEFNGELPSKSIDFRWKFSVNNIDYYAFHKYINENGGAQDNQFNDVLKSIIAARSIKSKSKHRVIFICDGNYFTKLRLKTLNTAVLNENHQILNINEVEEYLNEKNTS